MRSLEAKLQMLAAYPVQMMSYRRNCGRFRCRPVSAKGHSHRGSSALFAFRYQAYFCVPFALGRLRANPLVANAKKSVYASATEAFTLKLSDLSCQDVARRD